MSDVALMYRILKRLREIQDNDRVLETDLGHDFFDISCKKWSRIIGMLLDGGLVNGFLPILVCGCPYTQYVVSSPTITLAGNAFLDDNASREEYYGVDKNFIPANQNIPLISYTKTSASAEMAPKVFISYAYDSKEHEVWVQNLATKLRENGVNVLLDKWEVSPGEEFNKFMETSIPSSDYVVCVCSNDYTEKFNSRKNGAGYEARIISPHIENGVVIPIIRSNGISEPMPTSFGSFKYIDFSDDNKFADNLEELLAKIHNHQLDPKPSIGKNPFKK